MLKGFGLVGNIWFDESVTFPVHFSTNCIFHSYKDDFPYKEKLNEWELSHYRSTGRFPFVIEIKNEYERKNHWEIYYSLKNLVSIMRLIKYNRVYLDHLVSFEKNQVAIITSSDDPKPSSFLGSDEEYSKEDLQRIENASVAFKDILKKHKNERIIRALNLLNYSACSGTLERKVIELFAALESLFSTDTQEITYKLASRIAWLYYPLDSMDRVNMFNDIKAGYSIRSKTVHGDAFVKSTDMPLIKDLSKVARDIFIKIIFDKELLELFSSGKDKLEHYFNNLVMGNSSK